MRILVALLAATAILAAGCGGSSNDTEGTTAATETTAAATETDGPATDTTPVDTEAMDDAMDATGLSEGCQQVAGMSVAFASAIAAAGAPGADTADLEQAAAEYEALADELPDEIQDAVTTLAAAFAEYASAIAELDLDSGATPDAATIAKLTQIAATLDDQAIKDANETVSAWAEENCNSGG
jgi:hypothetical protein